MEHTQMEHQAPTCIYFCVLPLHSLSNNAPTTVVNRSVNSILALLPTLVCTPCPVPIVTKN